MKANDPRYMRPAEVDHLIGDATKAEQVLGWKPKVTFPELVEMMVKADLERERNNVCKPYMLQVAQDLLVLISAQNFFKMVCCCVPG